MIAGVKENVINDFPSCQSDHLTISAILQRVSTVGSSTPPNKETMGSKNEVEGHISRYIRYLLEIPDEDLFEGISTLSVPDDPEFGWVNVDLNLHGTKKGANCETEEPLDLKSYVLILSAAEEQRNLRLLWWQRLDTDINMVVLLISVPPMLVISALYFWMIGREVVKPLFMGQ